MRISDWSSDVCSSDLHGQLLPAVEPGRIDRDGQRPPAAHRRAVAKREVGPLIALRCDIAVAAIDERDDVGGIIGPAGCVPERVRCTDDRRVRSEERRVGKEGVSTCKSGVAPDYLKKKTK